MNSAGSHASRRSHRKSRGGCINCKRRKVKCDEERPSCTPCLRHSVECHYPAVPPTGRAPPRTRGGDDRYNDNPEKETRKVERVENNDSRLESSSTKANLGKAEASYVASSLHNGDKNLLPMNMVDLELLHNFVTSTSYTLSQNAEVKAMWRLSVPQLGFAHDYVMHAILALSARHMGRYRHENTDYYSDQATAHHQSGLQTVNAILPDVNKDNCSAVHIFSAITCYLACAESRRQGGLFLVSENGVAAWVVLVRGACTVVKSSSDWLHTGPIAPMFLVPMRQQAIKRASTSGHWEQPFDLIRQRIKDAVHNEHTLRTYTETLDILISAFPLVYNRGPHFCGTAEVFRFFYQVTDEYLSLLYQQKPEALVILAHFCVLLKQLDGFWWAKDLWETLLSAIYLHLTEVHRLWIRWPMEETGWMPGPMAPAGGEPPKTNTG